MIKYSQVIVMYIIIILIIKYIFIFTSALLPFRLYTHTRVTLISHDYQCQQGMHIYYCIMILECKFFSEKAFVPFTVECILYTIQSFRIRLSILLYRHIIIYYYIDKNTYICSNVRIFIALFAYGTLYLLLSEMLVACRFLRRT